MEDIPDALHAMRLVSCEKPKKGEMPTGGTPLVLAYRKLLADDPLKFSAELRRWEKDFAGQAKSEDDAEVDIGSARAEELVRRLLDEFEEEEKKRCKATTMGR